MSSVRPRIQLRDSAGVAPDFPARSACHASPRMSAGQGLAPRAPQAQNPGYVVTSSLRSLQQLAARNGLNLFGAVDARRFDRSQPSEQRTTARLPGCGTVLVLGTAGRSFWLEFARQGRGLGDRGFGDRGFGDRGRVSAAACTGEPGPEEIDQLVSASLDAVEGELARCGVRALRVDARSASLRMLPLAEAAGFGVLSPVSGMLLHPDYGPWLRVRAAFLLEGAPFGALPDASMTESFRPCCGCARPCLDACPPQVHDALGRSDRRRCAENRMQGACATGCGSRRACPVGAEHADPLDAPVHAHAADLPTLERWYGLGWWRFVPRGLRGGVRSR